MIIDINKILNKILEELKLYAKVKDINIEIKINNGIGEYYETMRGRK